MLFQTKGFQMKDNLIFDLGFHNGDDTDFYLKKGFNVVAIEANPILIKEGIDRFSNEIKAGQLQLLHKAIADKNGSIEFFIHPNYSDWSSCFENIAQSDGSTATKIVVECITVNKLFELFGTPRYVKVDIEGFDLVVAKEIMALSNKPQYISFETNRREFAQLYAYLYAAGYTKFQLVNQQNNPYRISPQDSSEGFGVEYAFGKYSSGLFGTDLPQEKWVDINESISQYVFYKTCKQIDNKELGLGWLDLHATF
jgi:FkbM family methyltransferase